MEATSNNIDIFNDRVLKLSCGDDVGDQYGGEMYADYVFARKYIDPEPTVTIVVEEPLIQETAVRTGYFEFFVDRENERWLLIIPDKEYTTGWMPFSSFSTYNNNIYGGYFGPQFYLKVFYSPTRCYIYFIDYSHGITLYYGG